MAAEYDVAARLAEGRQAVETTQSYVWASHLLGYQNPDLALNPAQICDWYSSEDGMDLHVLDADHSALQAAAAGADNALGRQRDQLACLAAAWQGDGAASATEFLRRHCDSAENVATTARTAADGLAALRDALWRIVDTKVAAVSAIDNRRQGGAGHLARRRADGHHRRRRPSGGQRIGRSASEVLRGQRYSR